MAPKRVLVVPSWYPSEASPISGIFVRDQVEVLARRYALSVYVPYAFPWRSVLTGGEAPQRGLTMEAGVPVYRDRVYVPVRLAGPYSMGALYTRFHDRLRAFLARFGAPDVIHAHVALPAGWLAARAGNLLGIPVVLSEHAGPFSVLLGSQGQRELVRQALAGARAVLAVSPALVDQMRSAFPGVAIDATAALVRTDLFTPASAVPDEPGREKVFACVALLDRGKGIDVLLQAAKLLHDERRGFRLVIGGDGPERARLETLARSLGLADRCKFLGLLDRDGVRGVMQGCDAFVLPSLAETFGLVLGEAMACGKPVIGTRCGGPEFVVTPETGVLVPAGDPAALADAMRSLLDGRWAFDAATVRSSIERRFGPAAFVERLSKVYSAVLR